MDVAIFAVTTVVALLVTSQYFLLSRLKYIKNNWSSLRCNPIYMPMAGYVGEDIATNFTKCGVKMFHDYAGFIMDPVMHEFSVVSSTFSEIGGAMNDMRGMFSGVRSGFTGILGMVFGKIHNTMSQTQYLMIRIRTLMARIIGVMTSFIYIFYGGMQTGEAVVNGPIGKTVNVLSKL